MSGTRRAFLGQSSAILAAASLRGAGDASSSAKWIDVNVWLGKWPFRELPMMRDASMLAAMLAAAGVTEAWAAPFEGLFERDLAVVNQRLADACAAEGARLRPVGIVNPALPHWEDDLRRCAEEHAMRIVRVAPNYHGFSLDDPRLTSLLEKAGAMNVAVQIVAQMEDQRTQHPAVQVAPVDLGPLPGILNGVPEARVMVLNANAKMVTTALRDCQTLWLDIAMIEAVGGVANLLEQWPNEKVCFGSFSPLFYWESASLKLRESDLNGPGLDAVKEASAGAFLKA